jgi:hypothetical protein
MCLGRCLWVLVGGIVAPILALALIVALAVVFVPAHLEDLESDLRGGAVRTLLGEIAPEIEVESVAYRRSAEGTVLRLELSTSKVQIKSARQLRLAGVQALDRLDGALAFVVGQPDRVELRLRYADGSSIETSFVPEPDEATR